MNLSTPNKTTPFVNLFNANNEIPSQNDDFVRQKAEFKPQNLKKFTKTLTKSKNLGQVFTPPFVVDLMLKMPQNKALCGRKILEAGCGDGAFLTALARRYVSEFLDHSKDLKRLKFELETNLIGVEIDTEILNKCHENLDKVASEFGLKNVAWNLQNGDFLELYENYKTQIDLIIGNPPYIRVHNLNENARKFTRGGMSDLFLIFFELGFECLKKGGELVFITPSSWLNSKAGASLRRQICAEKNLTQIIDFLHEKVFDKITTYSLISAFQKGEKSEFVECGEFANGEISKKRKITYENLFLPSGEIFLGETKFKKILNLKPLAVKNGFATLCDAFFFGDFSGFAYPKIRAYKASNGKWCECIYPYDENGVFIKPSGAVLKRYDEYEKRLKSRDLRGASWLEFGRSQGLKDTHKRKIAFNTLICELKDLRICEVKAGEGVFGGLYVASDLPVEHFEKTLRNDEFLGFVRSLGKYKNGGYYTFSSTDLGRFLAYKFGAF